ncbi:MAG: flavodoxin domain-containing protein [Polyangiaceae bacterium]
MHSADAVLPRSPSKTHADDPRPVLHLLVLYFSYLGHTRKVAERIGARLGRRGHNVLVLDVQHLSPIARIAGYDAIVMGAAVRSSAHAKEIARFIERHKALLHHVPTLFYSVGLSIASTSTDGPAVAGLAARDLFSKTGFTPTRTELVAGALSYTKYNFVLRFFMKRLATHLGLDTDTSKDWEYTDWDAVDAFTDAFIEGAEERKTPLLYYRTIS